MKEGAKRRGHLADMFTSSYVMFSGGAQAVTY